MSIRNWAATAAMAALCVCGLELRANEPWQEYDKLINSRQSVTAHGPQVFGDAVDLATGRLSFSSTDVALPGNSGLAIQLTRVYRVRSGAGFPNPEQVPRDGHFGDWELELPRIEGVFAVNTGWVNSNPLRAPYRCSVENAAQGRQANVTVGTNTFHGHTIWSGTRVHIGSGGGQALLWAQPGTQRPTQGGPYYWITSDWTYVSCLPSIRNGSGEGFLAVTPDGTRYWFDWMAGNQEGQLRQRRATVGFDVVSRKRYALYATRVEDRFGNWVAYSYSNVSDAPVRLVSIDSSDGRRISLGYSGGFVSTATDGRSTWQYQYNGTTLTGVTLPDGSRWTIDFAQLGGPISYYTGEPGEQYRNCYNPGDVREPVTPRFGRITHPSGATGEFWLDVVRFRRTVPDSCIIGNPKITNDDYSYYPNVWDSLALAKKRVTGPGISPQEWIYEYEHEAAHVTRVINPDGTSVAQYYGAGFKTNEGKLLRVERRDAAGTVQRTDSYTYQLDPGGQSYASPIGVSPQLRSDDYSEEYPRPEVSRQTVVGSDTFIRTVEQFDYYARPVRVRRSRN